MIEDTNDLTADELELMESEPIVEITISIRAPASLADHYLDKIYEIQHGRGDPMLVVTDQAARIARHIEAKKLSVRSAAEAIGVAMSTVHKAMRGKYSQLSYPTCEKFRVWCEAQEGKS